MKKTKRILALSGALLLVFLYLFTLFAALTTSKAAPGLFQASLFCTFFVPIMLYAYTLLYKVLKNKDSSEDKK